MESRKDSQSYEQALSIVNLIVGIVALLASGLAGMLLWGWFLVPLFHLPAIGITHAIGLILLLHVCLPSHPRFLEIVKMGTEDNIYGALLDIANSIGAIVIGWVIKIVFM